MTESNAPGPRDRPIRWGHPKSPQILEWERSRRVPHTFPEDPDSDIGQLTSAVVSVLAEALRSNGMWVRFRYFGVISREEEAAAAEAAIHSAAEALGLKIATLRQGWMIEVRSALEKRLGDSDTTGDAPVPVT